MAAGAVGAGEGRFLDEYAVREEVHSPTYRAGLFSPDTCAIVHPDKPALELARACTEAGVQIYDQTPATSLETRESTVCAHRGRPGHRTAGGAGHQRLPELLRRNRLHTVPVHDYILATEILATEPLTEEQSAGIGWRNRHRVGDSANQVPLLLAERGQPHRVGGYDAVYHFGRRVGSPYEDRPAELPAAGRPLLPHVPAIARRPVRLPLGGCDRHQHPVLRALGPRPRWSRRVHQRVHRPGSRCGPLLRRCVP